MTFGKRDGKPDKSVIVYNEHLILRDILLTAYDYIVNGKSALDWIMERYQATRDKDSQITNDPTTGPKTSATSSTSSSASSGSVSKRCGSWPSCRVWRSGVTPTVTAYE
jgi:hypothetical protein